ncbi:MAG: organic radical activating enzyme [Myxococcota bacterium]
MSLLAYRKQPRPPFADLEPTVEWQVNGVCNYDCTYCIQSRAYRTGMPDQAVSEAIVTGLAALPGRWEIKMSGGEPFAYPGLMRWVIPGLVEQTRHRISILTNLSASLKTLGRFSELTGSRLSIVSASLHLEYVDSKEWIAKAVEFAALRDRHNPRSSFVVNSVLVPGRLAEQRDIKERVEAAGLRYFPQLMKIKGGVFPYSAREQQIILELTGGSESPRDVNRAPSYEGHHCEAGAWYFVVDQRGEAWSCRTGKRFAVEDDREAYMGNLADGSFARRQKGGLCSYSICPCTVPANRGVIRGI